jgi:hypothetical protein
MAGSYDLALEEAGIQVRLPGVNAGATDNILISLLMPLSRADKYMPH